MILIVDDDRSVTASLALLLKQAGLPSIAAGSPDEALEVLRRAAVSAGDPGHELLAPHLGRGGAGAAAADQGG